MSRSIATRRAFLLSGAAAALTGLGASSGFAAEGLQRPLGEAGGEQVPSHGTLLKFNRDGSVRGFAGNTVICHLPAQSVVRDAIVALHDELARSSLRQRISLLPPDSLHMTVFSGANDQDRVRTGWPSDVPLSATIEECNRVVGERMKSFHLQCGMPLRMQLDEAYTLRYGGPCSLRMKPVDEAETSKLRGLRDRLAEVYRFRAGDHDRYEFHITVAYPMAVLSDEEKVTYLALLRRHLPLIASAAPVLELGPPEFCTFKDMYRFEPRTMLAT